MPSMNKTRSFITGGFKTVGAMVNTLETVDGVGLGRPVCQEPSLAAELLSGKVKGAIKMKLNDDDFGTTNVVAGTQIGMIGRDEEPVDLSNDEHLKVFNQSIAVWQDKLANDTGLYSSGFVRIENFTTHPYGKAY